MDGLSDYSVFPFTRSTNSTVTDGVSGGVVIFIRVVTGALVAESSIS